MTNQKILERVDEAEIYRYLSAKQTPDDNWKAYIKDILIETASYMSPSYVAYEETVHVEHDFTHILSHAYALPSRSFAKHIEGSQRLWIVAATLGHAIERKIKFAFTLTPSKAVIMDACGSALIEAYCDCIEEALLEKMTAPVSFTSRFSPGYGDLALDLQKTLFELYPISKNTGIHLTSGSLMIPQKSVVFLVADGGKASGVKACLHKCASCTLTHCIYRTEEN